MSPTKSRKSTNTCDLYRWYDKEGNLLYVGISISAISRASQHKSSSDWYKEARYMTIEKCKNRHFALKKEMRAIKTEKPIWNISGNHHRTCECSECSTNYNSLSDSSLRSVKIKMNEIREKERLIETIEGKIEEKELLQKDIWYIEHSIEKLNEKIEKMQRQRDNLNKKRETLADILQELTSKIVEKVFGVEARNKVFGVKTRKSEPDDVIYL